MTINKVIVLLHEFAKTNKELSEEYAKDNALLMKTYCRGRYEAFETAVRWLEESEEVKSKE